MMSPGDCQSGVVWKADTIVGELPEPNPLAAVPLIEPAEVLAGVLVGVAAASTELYIS